MDGRVFGTDGSRRADTLPRLAYLVCPLVLPPFRALLSPVVCNKGKLDLISSSRGRRGSTNLYCVGSSGRPLTGRLFLLPFALGFVVAFAPVTVVTVLVATAREPEWRRWIHH